MIKIILKRIGIDRYTEIETMVIIVKEIKKG